MTDREAIANLTYRRDCWIGIKYHNNEPEPWVSCVLEEAMQKGAEALQEREERSKGCEYCNTEYDILLPTDMGYTWIYGIELQNAYGSCEIKFCPMCGRKLSEPPKEGAEG